MSKENEEEAYHRRVLEGERYGMTNKTGLIEALRQARPEDREAFCNETIALLAEQERRSGALKALQAAADDASVEDIARVTKILTSK